jgi:hypothetical protein
LPPYFAVVKVRFCSKRRLAFAADLFADGLFTAGRPLIRAPGSFATGFPLIRALGS